MTGQASAKISRSNFKLKNLWRGTGRQNEKIDIKLQDLWQMDF